MSAHGSLRGVGRPQSRSRHCAYSRSQPPLSRATVAGDNPLTDSPNNALRASAKSFVDIPFRYSHGNTASTRLVFFKYDRNNSERKHRPAPDLSRVRGNPHRGDTRQYLPRRQVAVANERTTASRVMLARVFFQKGPQLRFHGMADDSLRALAD